MECDRSPGYTPKIYVNNNIVKRQKTDVGIKNPGSMHPSLEIKNIGIESSHRAASGSRAAERSAAPIPLDGDGYLGVPTVEPSILPVLGGDVLPTPDRLDSATALRPGGDIEDAVHEDKPGCRKNKKRKRKRVQESRQTTNDVDITRLRAKAKSGFRSAGKMKPQQFARRLSDGYYSIANILQKKPALPRRAPIRHRGCHNSHTPNNISGLNNVYIEKEQYENTSLLFDIDEFKRLNYLYGPVTMDANASIHTSVHDNFCGANTQKFWTTDLAGQSVWLLPPFSEDAVKYITHFENERKKYPYELTGLLVIPKWSDRIGSQLQELVKYYKKIQTYPAGTYLFKQYDEKTQEYTSMEPIPFDIEVYYVDSEVEERQMQAANDQVSTAALKQMGAYPFKSKKKKDDAGMDIDESEPDKVPDISNLTLNEEGEVELHTIDITDVQNTPSRKNSASKISIANVTGPSTDELLVVPIPILELQKQPIKTLIDSGATLGFADTEFVNRYKLATQNCPQKIKCYLGDGETWKMATKQVALTLDIGGVPVVRNFIITKLKYDLILGHDFLADLNPDINWKNSMLRLRTENAKEIQCAIIEREIDITVISANETKRVLRKLGKKINKNPDYESQSELFLGIVKAIPEDQSNTVQSISQTAEEKIRNLKTDQLPEFTEMVRNKIRKYSLVFEPLTGLPPSRPGYDHKIELKPDASVPTTRIYNVSPAQLDELKKQLCKYLDKKWIRESFSEFASPILFVRKKNTTDLRMCVDYRRLNEITKDIEYPLPSIDVLLDQLGNSKIWTSLDLSTGYHQVRMERESIPKTSFKTQLGQFQFEVMPFGLKCAPATFQRLMNKILEPHKNNFVLVYLDDILICSRTLSEHLEHLDFVLAKLAENQLRLNPDKCFWGKSELEYLGHVVNAQGIKPSQSKIKAVLDWRIPTCVREVQSFTGFVNYYRRYIKNFSKTAVPLYNLCKKKVHGRIVTKILDAKVGRHSKYDRGPCLTFKIRWQDPKLKDSWECWSDVKKLDLTKDYCKIKGFNRLRNTAIYKRYAKAYPSRFPEGEGM